MCHSMQQQRGSMLVIALFAIIVLALLAGSMISILSASSDAVIYEVYGQRAKNSAQAGLQTMAMQAFPLNAAPQMCAQTLSSPLSFSTITGFNNCSYQVSCDTTEINYKGAEHYFYRFSSTGICQVNDITVRRTLAIDAMQAR